MSSLFAGVPAVAAVSQASMRIDMRLHSDFFFVAALLSLE